MKKFFVCATLSFLLSYASHVFAQTDKELDFFKLPDDLKFTYKRKEVVRLKIININRFIYKVSAEKTETDFHMTVPAVMSGIKLPAFVNTVMPDVGSAQPMVKLVTEDQTQAKWRTDIENNIKALISIEQQLNSAVSGHNAILNYLNSCSDATTQIIANVIAELKRILPKSAASTVDAFSKELETHLKQNIDLAGQIEAELGNQYEAWKKQNLIEYRNALSVEKENLSKLEKELAILQEKLKAASAARKPEVQKEVDTKESEIRKKERKIEELKEDQISATKFMSDEIEKATSLVASIQKFDQEGKSYSLIANIKKANESNFIFFSEEVKMLKDEVKISVTATSEGQMTCDKPNEKKFTVKLRTKGGAKLDFSTGVFGNFGSKEFQGQTFYYQPVDDEHSRINAADAGKRFGLSVGALMHIYKRSPCGIKPGISVGVSTTTDLDALNFHIGPSLLLGDEERFCITAGLTFRQVKVLDRRFVTGEIYDKSLLPEAIPMVSKFPVAGTFVALTYNLSRFNK